MSRYSARIRQLENRIAPGCPLCHGYPAVAFVTIHGDETPPPAPPPCAACGKVTTRFIVHHAADTVAPSEQRAADLPRRAPAAESVPPTEDVKPCSQRRSKPLARRRRYYGPQ